MGGGEREYFREGGEGSFLFMFVIFGFVVIIGGRRMVGFGLGIVFDHDDDDDDDSFLQMHKIRKRRGDAALDAINSR